MPRTATGLYVPSSVVRQQQEQTQEFTAEVLEMVQRFHGTMKHWTEVYQRELNDDRLEIIFVPPTADAEVGVVPGRYHWLRYNEPPAPPTIEAIEGKYGEFVEPGYWHIEQLRGSDLQNPQVLRAQREAREAREAEKERERQRETEERQEHLRDAYNARFRTSVSMNKDVPWSQNAKGARAVRGKK